MSSELSRRLARKMEEAHRILGQRLASVRQALDGARPWEELARELPLLRADLEQHFVLEETEIYMRVEGMDTVQWERIRGLAAEHRALLEELTAIQKDLAEGDETAVRNDLAAFLRKVARHEHKEVQIVEEAYGTSVTPPA